MFPKFEKGEAAYKESGNKLNMMNITNEPRLFYNKPMAEVQNVYSQTGFSDFLKAGSFMCASNKVQRIFFKRSFQGIQFIPLLVDNNGIHHGYSFMHKISTYDVLDPIASGAKRFDEEDQSYEHVSHLYLDKQKMDNANILHDIFMCSTYPDDFICNEYVKDALEASNITGIEFDPVEFSS